MMATFMAIMIPRAAVCAERIRRCSAPTPRSPRRRRRSPTCRRVGRAGAPGRRAALPGRGQPGAARHLLPRRARDGRRRSSAAPAPARRRCCRWSRGCSTSPAARCSSTASTCGTGARGALEPDRPGAAEGVPVHRHGGEQPALRRARRHRRGAVGRARGRPGARLREPRWPGGLEAADQPGRHATSPAGSGSGWRSPGRWSAGREIYLFDDSFSALDLATDARLRAALRPWTREATVVIVAQRVSTIVDADQIVVLEDGRRRRAAARTRSCSTTCPTYQEIVESQHARMEAVR